MNDLTRDEQIAACSDCIGTALTSGETAIPLEVGLILLNEVDLLRDKIEQFNNTDNPTHFNENS